MHSSAGLTGGPELASGSATAPPPVPAGPESADAPQALVAGGSDAVAPTMQPVVATAVTIVDAVAVVGSIWTPPETLAPFGRKRGAPSAPSDAGNATKIGARAGISWQVSDNYRLAVEIGKPIYQNLNGPQTREDWRSSLQISRPF